MPYRDMRDFLATLEQQNLVKRVHREVDHNWEVACLAKWMYQALPIDRRFGLYFQNVKGFRIPVITGALGAAIVYGPDADPIVSFIYGLFF